MNTTATIEIFLEPGDTYFGGARTRIRTVLGSCVAIVLWHPERKLGGMCHFMLPGSGRQRGLGPDGRYAEDAFALLLQAAGRHATRPDEYQVKVFGGGDMFPDPDRHDGCQIGRKNVDVARRLVARYGMRIVAEHLEGIGHRSVVFDVGSGEVLMRQSRPVQMESNRSLLPCAA